jgi:hypothetical protein
LKKGYGKVFLVIAKESAQNQEGLFGDLKIREL